MSVKRVQKKIAWTEQDRARHKAIRETFKDEPNVDELIARGELTGTGLPLGVYLGLRVLVKSLRKMREEAQVSLAEVSARCGMDKATVSRLENGHVPNPGIETICRYLSALEKGIEWRVVPAPTAANGNG